MTNNCKMVFRGFTKLTDKEQNEFIDELNDYLKANISYQKQLKEGLEKSADGIVLGPLNSTCVCCGR